MGSFGGNFGTNFEGSAASIPPATKTVTAVLCTTTSTKNDLCATQLIKEDLCM